MRNTLKYISVGLTGLVLLLGISTVAQAYIYYPTLDTYVMPDQETTYETSDTLYVSDSMITVPGQESIDVRTRSYLIFDLSSIPTNAIITSASFNFYHAESGEGGEEVNLHAVTGYWDSSLVWDTQPDHGTIAASSEIGGEGYHQWASTNFIDLVQDWVEGSMINYGIMLECDLDEIYGEIAYGTHYSVDYADSNYHPYLNIEYEVGEPNPVPEPATMMMLVSLATGLFGFAGIRRRFSR